MAAGIKHEIHLCFCLLHPSHKVFLTGGSGGKQCSVTRPELLTSVMLFCYCALLIVMCVDILLQKCKIILYS